MIQKFIFIHENDFNQSKLTFESGAESLNQILTDFADFLRGAGFQIDGYLDVVSYDDQSEDYSDHYPENVCSSQYNDMIDDEELDYEHPEANFDWDRDTLSLCPVCKIDTNIMKGHECFDKNCPKSFYELNVSEK